MSASPANRRYRCAHGEIAITVTSAAQWHALAVCLGRPELAYAGAWEAVQTAASYGPIAAVLEEMFSEDDASSWAQRLGAHRVPYTVFP